MLSNAVAERILALRDSSETDTDFARRIGLTPQLINNYRAKRHGTSLEALAAVASQTDVNVRWLLTGEGPRHDVDQEERDAQMSAVDRVTRQIVKEVTAIRSAYGLEDLTTRPER